MNERSELHDWLIDIKVEYSYEKDTEKAIKLRNRYIKLRRIYDRMNWLWRDYQCEKKSKYRFGLMD